MLVSYRGDDNDLPLVGVLDRGVIKTGPEFLSGRSLLDVIVDWDDISAKLQASSPASSTPVSGARLTTPLQFPGKVLCAGANYYGHLEEMGIERPDGTRAPYFFFKPP